MPIKYCIGSTYFFVLIVIALNLFGVEADCPIARMPFDTFAGISLYLSSDLNCRRLKPFSSG